MSFKSVLFESFNLVCYGVILFHLVFPMFGIDYRWVYWFGWFSGYWALLIYRERRRSRDDYKLTTEWIERLRKENSNELDNR